MVKVSIIGLSKRFRISANPRWVFKLEVKKWFEQRARGRVLHLCCGKTHFPFAINVDIDPESSCDLIGDMFNPPLRGEAFDTIICDPPYRLAIDRRPEWVRALTTLVKKRKGSRILLKTDFIPYFGENWVLRELVVYQGAKYWVPVSLLLFYELADPTLSDF